MAKIARVVQKIFGSTAPSAELGQIGSLAAGAATNTTDLTVMQGLTNYLRGWYGCVTGNNSPAMEDMNSLHYLMSYQLAYIMQQGVAEWQTDTEYHIGSIVQDGLGNLFTSITDTNSGNALTDIDNWKVLLNVEGGLNLLDNAQWRFSQEKREQIGTEYECDDGEFFADRWLMQTDATSGDTKFKVVESHNISPTPTTKSDHIMAIFTEGTTDYIGALQMLNAPGTQKLRGKTLSFNASIGGYGVAGEEVRIAIVEWTGTQDSFDRSAVQTWAASPTAPTLKTDWNIVAVSDAYDPDNGDGGLDGMIEAFVSGEVASDAENVGVFIFSASTHTGASESGFYLGNMSLEIGPGPTDFNKMAIDFAEDYSRCMRYYETSMGTGDIPGDYAVSGRNMSYWHTFAYSTTACLELRVPFKSPKYTRPTSSGSYTFYSNDVTPAIAKLKTRGSAILCTPSFVGGNTDGFMFYATRDSGTWTAGDPFSLGGQWVCDVRLGV